MQQFFARLREPSTAAALAAPLLAFGVIDEGILNQAGLVLGAISALFGVIRPEGRPADSAAHTD